MDESAFNQRSCTSARTSERTKATPTAPGFTAGGSGTGSTEAIASNRPRAQNMHDLNFIPELHQDTNDKPNFRCRTFEKSQETVLQRADGGMSTHFSGSPGFRKITGAKRNSTIRGRVVGYSYPILAIWDCGLGILWSRPTDLLGLLSMSAR